MEIVLNVTKNDLIWSSSSNHVTTEESDIDRIFKMRWKTAERKNVMNYKVDEESLQTKILPGHYKLVAQFNPMRVTKRRPPEQIVCLKQPFDTNKFNFTKIKDEEILFEVVYKECCWKTKSKTLSCTMIVNSAPISPFHGLLIPARFECKPQVLNLEGLELGIISVLTSNTPAVKVGFNSLGGMATVNHYHFHVYYLQHPLYVETADCEKVGGQLYVFKDHYAPGFVLEVESKDIEETARNVMKLIDFFHSNDICHNVMITRGLKCQKKLKHNENVYDAVRVCIWSRKPSFGCKHVVGFACALCEFGGHLPVYDKETWERIGEQDVIEATRDVCCETYNTFLPKIKELFS